MRDLPIIFLVEVKSNMNGNVRKLFSISTELSAIKRTKINV